MTAQASQAAQQKEMARKLEEYIEKSVSYDRAAVIHIQTSYQDHYSDRLLGR